MTNGATQQGRPAELTTPLGPDRLLVTGASIHERLSGPFTMEIRAISPDPDLDLDALLGQRVNLRVRLPEGRERHFNGHVFRVSQEAAEEAGAAGGYLLTVRPWLWFLSRTADCRIFQNKSVPEIVKEIFREHGHTDFEERLSADYAAWEYCAQYRETDFNFISRLLEQEGIYYYFRHEKDRHTLVLADAPDAHEPIAGAESLRYEMAGRAETQEAHVYRWDLHKVLQPGTVVLNDFDFRKPSADLQASAAQADPGAGAQLEVYDYPGEYTEPERGDFYARARLEALHSRYERMEGASDTAALYAGGLFDLREHPRADQNRRYLILDIHHEIAQGGYRSDEGVFDYGNHFTVIDAQTPFRPERRTPKPYIRGPQTALVVGPSGEEIHTDEYGRVKLQFHWDRYGKRDENSSCWVRVAQVWAGKNWGGIHIPRIGQEVIVEFLEGDPDRPIVTGRVYNAEQMPPYDLPAHKTRSGIKSRSSKGGSPSHFNEIRFEDKKGEEEILVHAERDLHTEVERDERHWVGGDRRKEVDGDETTTIRGRRTETVHKDERVEIQGNRDFTVKMNHDFGVEGNETYKVAGNRTTRVNAFDNYEVQSGRNDTIHAMWTQTVHGPWTQTIHGPWTQTVNGPVVLTATGGFNIIAPGGTNIVDFQLMKTGGFLKEGYLSKLDIDVNTNSFNATSFGATGFKVEYAHVQAAKTSVTLLSPTTKVERAAALEALSTATGIEMDTLKIFL